MPWKLRSRTKVELQKATLGQKRILKSFGLGPKAVPNYILKYRKIDFFRKKVNEYLDYVKKKEQAEEKLKAKAKKKPKSKPKKKA